MCGKEWNFFSLFKYFNVTLTATSETRYPRVHDSRMKFNDLGIEIKI